jgi:hypothetical protein
MMNCAQNRNLGEMNKKLNSEILLFYTSLPKNIYNDDGGSKDL